MDSAAQDRLKALMRQLAFVERMRREGVRSEQPKPCPYCGVPNDALTAMETRTSATVGDVAICIECAMPAMLDAQLQLRVPTFEEKLLLDDLTQVQEARALVLEKKRLFNR